MSFSTESKKSSTTWPILTEGISRELFPVARILRSWTTTIQGHEDLAFLEDHTFSSIFDKGPPPPSPFPNTRRATSEDSRFLTDCQNWTVGNLACLYLMIRNSLLNVADRSLRRICVCDRRERYQRAKRLDHRTNWRHMTQHLSPINADPIESGMWEDISTRHNRNEMAFGIRCNERTYYS